MTNIEILKKICIALGEMIDDSEDFALSVEIMNAILELAKDTEPPVSPVLQGRATFVVAAGSVDSAAKILCPAINDDGRIEQDQKTFNTNGLEVEIPITDSSKKYYFPVVIYGKSLARSVTISGCSGPVFIGGSNLSPDGGWAQIACVASGDVISVTIVNRT